MRKMVVAALLLVCAVLPAAGQNSLGAGLVYDNHRPLQVGIQLSGYRALEALQGVRVGGDFTYYLPATDTLTFSGHVFDYRASLWELNGNLQYHFIAGRALSPYSLVGINFSRRGIASAATGATEATPQALTTFNGTVGAGVEFSTGFGVLYGEGRYMAAPGRHRTVLGVGARIGL